jgi:lauroyl/myristoyl acyltransferase
VVYVPADVAVGRTAADVVRNANSRAGFLITTVRTRLLLATLRATSWAAGVIPRHAVAEPACRLAGLIWCLAAPAAREAVRDNQRHVRGRAPTWLELARVFQNGALNYWDTFVGAHLTGAELLRLVNIHGLEHIEAAHAQGHGVIAISGHLGSVSFVGQFLPLLGYQTIGLLEPLGSPEIFDFFARQREGHRERLRLLPAGTSALKELLLALQRNEVVGLVTDRDVTGTGPMIPFFDAPTRFPDGAAALSLRTGAPIISTIAVRLANGHFDLLIDPLPATVLTGDSKQDVLLLTRVVANRLEYHIASHPEQWTVFQKRWPDAQPGA